MAVLSVNAELIRLYWDIGRIIDSRQKAEGWGAAVIPRLSRELQNELPEVKGFSERNIGRMIAFFRAYPCPTDFLPQPAAKLPAIEKIAAACGKIEASAKVPQPPAQTPDSLLWAIPWFHHVVLMEKVKDRSGSPLVHAANARQRLEPQCPAGHDPVRGPSPPGQGHHQLRASCCRRRSPTLSSRRSKTRTSSTS